MINGQVSHWWQDIGPDDPRPALAGAVECDVAIVGAGYTGLWTAYYLKRTDRTLRVCVIEQRHVGFGASGRNGGWLTNSITGGRQQYVPRFGWEAAATFQRAMNGSVNEVISVADAEGIDAEIVKGGEFTAAWTPAQEARLRRAAAAERRWPGTDVHVLEQREAKERIDLVGMRAATWHPHAARIHPAKLVRGLGHVVERMGVRIYEGTRADQIRPGEVRTSHGPVRAEFVVRATEGFTANLQGLRRTWLPMNSSLIVTEPLSPQTWATIGWEGREVLGDMAHLYFYAQRTGDDRIAIGGRGLPYRYASRTDRDGHTPPTTAHALASILNRLFPATTGCAVDHVWSGVLGVPRDWAATVGLDRVTGLGWGGGYVGTGVTSTNLAGRTLADLILGQTSELTSLPWVNHRVRRWEPEPLRWVAARGLHAAYGIADRREQKTAKPATSAIADVADVITGRK